MRSPLHYARVILSQSNPPRFLASRLLRAMGVSQWVTMRIDPRYRLRLFPTSITESYWMNPHDRAEDHSFLDAVLRPGDTVIDVGANIGALSLQASAIVGPQGRVLSIEPHPQVFRFLEGNIAVNRFENISARNFAVGARTAQVTFSDFKDDDTNRVTLGSTGIPVDMVTLDDVAAHLGRIRLLKIDVEGYEKFVLEGAKKTLRRTDLVLFESYEPAFRAYGYGTVEVTECLRDAGFEIFREELTLPVPADYVSTRCENLVAARSQRWPKCDAQSNLAGRPWRIVERDDGGDRL